MGRKHCGKRNSSLRAISPFSHSVFKRLVSQGRQKVSLCWNGLDTNTANQPVNLGQRVVSAGSSRLKLFVNGQLSASAGHYNSVPNDSANVCQTALS